jgi:GT2 family glycosyltransferase
MNEPKINVVIPFEPDAHLGREDDRIMEESKYEWVLLLDHDVLILNPHWYYLCQEAIRKHPEAGLFTIFGSSRGCRFQKLKEAPRNDRPIPEHRKFAKKLWARHQFSCTFNDPAIPEQWISGYFMLTSKTAWQKAGGFGGDGLFGRDRAYHKKIVAAGLRCYRIDGIYCYHIGERIEGSWIPGIKTSKELWGEYWAAKNS